MGLPGHFLVFSLILRIWAWLRQAPWRPGGGVCLKADISGLDPEDVRISRQGEGVVIDIRGVASENVRVSRQAGAVVVEVVEP
jgi:hypothetical protein